MPPANTTSHFTEQVEAIAGNVTSLLDGRPLAWLSSQTGIKYTTLWAKMRTPSRLTVEDALAIAHALGLDLADLQPEDVAA